MTDLTALESRIIADIAAASDEAALEAVRVAALGKKGSISALLSTLGKMSPDERKTQGAAINLARDTVTQALSARRDILKSAALDARLASETVDVTLPLAFAAQVSATGKPRPISNWWLLVMGRTRPGVTSDQVRAELQPIFEDSVRESWAARPPTPSATRHSSPC